MKPLTVQTDIPGVHLEVEPDQNSDRSWRFVIVFNYTNDEFMELGGWRVDSKYTEILPPQFSMPKINRTFLLGRMSPGLKLDLLRLLKPAIELHIQEKERARLNRAPKKETVHA